MTILSAAQITPYARAAGFTGQALITAVAIALAESGGNTNAYNPETAAGTPIGSGSRGLWQIYGKVHPQYNNDGLYDPMANAKAAFNVSGGSNFQPWSTYLNGQYRAYLSAASSAVATGGGSTAAPAPAANVKAAASNTYPKGQCTWWASQRYHDLVGYYVPWMDNANGWARQAASYGWKVSNLPPNGPSILVLQGGVQGSNTTYGHVAVVEKVNPDGSVYTSDLDWPSQTVVSHITFRPGPGVQFVYATTNVISPTGGGAVPGGPVPAGGGPPVTNVTGAAFSGGFPSGVVSLATYTPLLDQVHETLINTPGFYGIALALDEAEKFPGYIDLTAGKGTTINIGGIDTGVPVPDVNGTVRSIGATISDNALPLAIRSSLVIVGVVLLIALFIKPIGGAIQAIAPLAEMAA